MIAHELRGRDLPVWLEAGCVIAGTVAARVLTNEAVRRVAPLRPLFGLRVAAFEPRALESRAFEPRALESRLAAPAVGEPAR